MRAPATATAPNVPFGCFQTLGDLRLDFGKSAGFEDYRRELDLDRGVVTVTYCRRGSDTGVKSSPAIRTEHWCASDRGSEGGPELPRPPSTRPERYETHAEKDHLLMTGTMDNGKGGEGLRYAVRLKAVATGGSVTCSE